METKIQATLFLLIPAIIRIQNKSKRPETIVSHIKNGCTIHG